MVAAVLVTPPPPPHEVKPKTANSIAKKTPGSARDLLAVLFDMIVSLVMIPTAIFTKLGMRIFESAVSYLGVLGKMHR